MRRLGVPALGLLVMLLRTSVGALPGGALQDCQALAEAKRAEIQAQHPKSNFTFVVFMYDGQLCAEPELPYSVQGEPIYVGIYDDLSDPHAVAPRLEAVPCTIEAAGVRIYAPASFADVKAEPVASLGPPLPANWAITMFGPRVCFDPAIQLTVKALKNAELAAIGQYTIGQTVRYHATIQLGAIFTDLHDREFALRADGETMRIREKGSFGTGPEYIASVLLYSLPRYLQKGAHYQGRDIVHDNDWRDRIGGILGVGLSEPNRRFVAGVSLELLTGLNIMGLYEVAKVKELQEVKIGDPFTGGADTIPDRDVWKKHFVAGISIDLRYAVALFKR